MKLTAVDINDTESLSKLILVELSYEIERCKARMRMASNAIAKKAFATRIKWLEALRISHHHLPNDQ